MPAAGMQDNKYRRISGLGMLSSMVFPSERTATQPKGEFYQMDGLKEAVHSKGSTIVWEAGKMQEVGNEWEAIGENVGENGNLLLLV